MLKPNSSSLDSFVDSLPSGSAYRLSDASVKIRDARSVEFRATLCGPTGASVWARAWLWNEIDNTLAEAASPELRAGDRVILTAVLTDARTPTHASMRIESAPLRTEHVITLGLT